MHVRSSQAQAQRLHIKYVVARTEESLFLSVTFRGDWKKRFAKRRILAPCCGPLGKEFTPQALLASHFPSLAQAGPESGSTEQHPSHGEVPVERASESPSSILVKTELRSHLINQKCYPVQGAVGLGFVLYKRVYWNGFPFNSECIQCCFLPKEHPSAKPAGGLAEDSGTGNTQNCRLCVAKDHGDLTAAWAVPTPEVGIGAPHQALLCFRFSSGRDEGAPLSSPPQRQETFGFRPTEGSGTSGGVYSQLGRQKAPPREHEEIAHLVFEASLCGLGAGRIVTGAQQAVPSRVRIRLSYHGGNKGRSHIFGLALKKSSAHFC
nr:uncharacterized protein LOC105871601 [Microcebus murinus]